jgi:hypothetical protein
MAAGSKQPGVRFRRSFAAHTARRERGRGDRGLSPGAARWHDRMARTVRGRARALARGSGRCGMVPERGARERLQAEGPQRPPVHSDRLQASVRRTLLRAPRGRAEGRA